MRQTNGLNRVQRTASKIRQQRRNTLREKGYPDSGLEMLEQRRLLSAIPLDLSFEQNVGQTDPQVNFLARGSGYALFLTSNEAVLSLLSGQSADGQPAGAVVRMQLVGNNFAPQIVGADELPGRSNYFLDVDPAGWYTDIPNFARVEYQDIYSGIDLAYLGNQGQLQYDFTVAPGADPGSIVINFDGVEGLAINAQGELVLSTAAGEVRQMTPFIYQDIDGVQQQIDGGYVLLGGNQVGFEIAAYDATRPLVIDPTLIYSTFLGGTSQDEAHAVAVDSAGKAYVTGFTLSSNFPTTSGAFDTSYRSGRDIFVTKLNSTGTALVYSTFIGGSGDEEGRGIAVDSSGNAYITGYTTSGSTGMPAGRFPTTGGGFDTGFNGGRDAFLTKLNAAGSALLYSTYLGGSSDEEGRGIALDSSGNAYITGFTESSSGIAMAGGFDTSHGGGRDAFVTKFNPTLSGAASRIYSTYIGGGSADEAFGIAVDGSGNAHVTGYTESSSGMPTTGGFDTTHNGGRDIFLTKLNAAGSAVLYSTYLGGGSADEGRAITLDSSGHAYITGFTESSSGIAMSGGFDTTHNGGRDVFVTKCNTTLTGAASRIYSTYIGGSSTDEGHGIAVDSAGNAYVTGYTESTGGMTTSDAIDTSHNGGRDVFVAVLNAAGSTRTYGTYLGGSGADEGRGIAFYSGSAFVAGSTQSSGFPTTSGAFDTTYNTNGDAFVLKIEFVAANTAPVAEDDSDSVTEDTDLQATGNVLANDNDAESNPLTVSEVNDSAGNVGTFVAGTYGSLVINADGSYTYDLDNAAVQFLAQGQTVTDSFTYTATDGLADSASATLLITIYGTNDAPVANADDNAGDAVVEDLDASASGNVLTNDTDVDTLDALSVSQVNGSAANVGMSVAGTYGSLLLNSDGSYTYTLNHAAVQFLAQGQTVTDVFNYHASDGLADSNETTLTITISGTNDAPVANADDNAGDAVVEDLDGSASGNVLTNDTDVDTLDTLSVSQVNGSAANVGVTVTGTYGSLVLNSDGSYTYTLNHAAVQFLAQGQTVTDVFNYHATDGLADSNETTLTITITGTNDAPVANADDNADDAVVEDLDGSASGNVLANDTDVDTLDTLSVSQVNGSAANVGVSVTGTYGSLMLDANGSYTYTLNHAAVQFLAQDQTVTDVFNYHASDGLADSNEATLTITISGTNDAPVANADDNAGDALVEDLDGSAGGNVLANDTDVDTLDTLSVSQVNGSAANVGMSVTGTYGSLFVNADGSYTYTLDNAAVQFLAQGQTVTDVFNYHASDGLADSNETTLTITISGTNDAPVAADDSADVVEDTVLQATGNVLGNDSDVDILDTLTVSQVNGSAANVGVMVNGTYGTVTINADGSYTYDLNNAAVQFLSAGQTVTDTFTYKASDGLADSNEATLTITITGANDDPVITSLASSADDCGCTSAGQPVTLSATFTDVDTNDTHTALIDWGDGSTSAGTIVGGSVSGSHAYSQGGVFTITLTVTDNNGGSDTQTTTAIVTGVGLNQGVLYIVGTKNKDQVQISKDGSRLKVVADFLGANKERYFQMADVQRMHILLCAGEDQLQIGGDISISSYIDAGADKDQIQTGAGNDTIYGGDGDDQIQAGSGNNFIDAGAGNDQIQVSGGNNIILGGAGADQIQGGTGRDLIIGGLGNDKLVGDGADDILIAGFTEWDNDVDALKAILAEWSRTDINFTSRVNNLKNGGGLNGTNLLNDSTAHDDGVMDELTGSSGSDWFLFNQFLDAGDDSTMKDKVTDASSTEKLQFQDIDFNWT